MQTFFKEKGIQHTTSPPYNPESNSQAEDAVKTFKKKIKTMLKDKKNNEVLLNTLVSRVLFSYRTSEHCSTKVSPASLMFNKDIRTKISILKEVKEKTTIQDKSKSQEDKTLITDT